MLLFHIAEGIRRLMFMAAVVGMIMMFFVVNMFVLMHLSIMLMSMGVFISGMTAHLFSPPIFLHNFKFDSQAIKALLLSIVSLCV